MATTTSASSQFQLRNTMTGDKETFTPREPGKVKIFTCGPSIYRAPHIGNYRTFVFEDVLVRYLEYLGYEVERIINFTDVEDKAISEAQIQGRSIHDLTHASEDVFFRDAELLNLKLPPEIPRSSTSVEQAATVISRLLDKGYAYWHDGDVFYDPLKFEGFGRLFGLDMSRWPKEKRRFRRDTYPGKRWNLGDFVLWHGAHDGDVIYWDTEIGKGRPAWNVQDAAMIVKTLGEQIDIACGGIDNLYRHHDYNIAVMEAFSGKEFARYWLHGEHLFIDGAKMSKSKGNIVYPKDLIDRGYDAAQIRFYLMDGHYRKKMNVTAKNLDRSAKRLDDLRDTIAALTTGEGRSAQVDSAALEIIDSLRPAFERSMNDDLHVNEAFDAVARQLSKLRSMLSDGPLPADPRAKLRANLDAINQVLRLGL